MLTVNHLLDPIEGGGTAERTLQLSRAFVRAGHQCATLTMDIGLTERQRQRLSGVPITGLPCINRRYFIPSSTRPVGSLVAASDVVHIAGHWTYLNAVAYRWCRKLGKPYVICPAGALKPFGRSLLLKQAYDLVVGRSIVRKSAARVAITIGESADFSRYGIDPDALDVIPNGIDPDDYPPAAQAEVDRLRARMGVGGARYILFLGRLNAIKGPDLLLQAFAGIAARFPDLHLVFAGPDAGLLAALDYEVGRLGCAHRVHFTGYMGGADKAAAIREAALLVIPSRSEAMSIVVLEAGICGTPVLFTDQCGLADLAAAGAGACVGATAEAIETELALLLVDSAALKVSADRLQRLVRERFLWSSQAERYIGVFERVRGQTA